MNQCKYCDFRDWTGQNLEFLKHIDGSKQNIEAYLASNPEQECKTLIVTGEFISIEIKLNYCPICGRKL